MFSTAKLTALFAVSVSLFQAISAQLSTGSLPLSDCDHSGVAQFTAGWSASSGTFCASQQTVGALICGLKVWTVSEMEDAHAGTHFFVDGMHVLYDNDKYTEIGRTDRGTLHEFFWWPNESKVAGLYLCPPDGSDFFVGMAMALNDGRWFIGAGCDNVVCSDDAISGSLNANFDFMDKCKTGLQGQPFAISGKTGKFGIEEITFKMWD